MKNRLIFKETWTESVTQQQQQQQLGIIGEDEAFEGINFWVSLNSQEKENRRD